MNYKQIYAMKFKREMQIKEICPEINNQSGIYVFFRVDENEIKHCYVGQAKHLLERTASHLGEYDRIALSLKKRGFYSGKNLHGWRLLFRFCSIEQLDELEKQTIKAYADKGFQLYNKTAGGQGQGKSSLDNQKPAKTYYDGLSQGYKNAQKFVANLFNKHLDYKKKSDKSNKNQDKAMQKFEDFLNIDSQP